MRKFASTGAILLLFTIFVWGQETAAPAAPRGWKKFEHKNYFSLYYPSNVFKARKKPSGVLFESEYWVNANFSDNRKIYKHPFSISFGVVRGGALTVMREKPCFADAFPNGTADSFRHVGGCFESGHSGFRIVEGVEGIHTTTTYLDLGTRETMIVRYTSFSGFIPQAKHDRITSEEQDRIYYQMLETLKVH